MKIRSIGYAMIWLASAATLSAQSAEVKPDTDEEEVSAPDKQASAMIGTYVGTFGTHKITICVDRVIGKTVTGYNIVSGNERAFSGTWSQAAGEPGFVVLAQEPGDDPADGIFKFLYSPEAKVITGQWMANDKAIGTRNFTLPARTFKYNPKAGKYPLTSTKKLKESDVENMKPADLRIMRNEIYARHGYSFKVTDMRDYFDKQDWYMPTAVDITTQLTTLEKNNAALIKRYEKYTEEYYDKFGR